MHDDDPAREEEIIQRRLAHVGGYRVGGPQFGLRGFLVVFTIAPCLVWLVYLAWPTIINALPFSQAAPKMTGSQQLEADPQHTPLIIGSFVPAVISSMVSAVVAFIMVRSLREHAQDGALAAVSLCGAAVILALTLAIAGKGGSTIAGADAIDVFVVYAIPVGIAVSVGAITGWRVAELE